MTIEEVVIARLLDTAAVTTLASSRVYPGIRPQGSALPAVVVSRVSGAPVYVDDGETGLSVARIQIDCWGETYSAAKSLVRAVVYCLSGFYGVLFDVQIQTTLLDNERDIQVGDTASLFRTSTDFMIWYS